MDIYLVGGAVRDSLLNLTIKEYDYVVVGATPQEMLALGYRLVGKDFPVFLHPQTKHEYALARTERKIGPGYKGFSVYAAPDVTLEDDLKRRDLTINAIAQTADGRLIDPFNGQSDLQKKLLRHVSPAFVEDPVRILRVARFAARFASLGFRVAPETMSLMQEMVANGEVDALVPERVWQEWQKSLMEAAPQEFIRVLRECGALKILFPEIDNLFGVPNPVAWHPEIDTGIHVLMVLEQAVRLSDDPVVRFAALVHDLGKGTTPKSDWPRHPGHEERGAQLIKQLGERYMIPREYQDLAILASQYHSHCHRVFELKIPTLLTTLEKLDAFRRPQRFEKFLQVCEADSRGRTGFEDKEYAQSAYFYKAYQIAAAVDVEPLVARGLQGKAFGDELHRLRIEALKEQLK